MRQRLGWSRRSLDRRLHYLECKVLVAAEC